MKRERVILAAAIYTRKEFALSDETARMFWEDMLQEAEIGFLLGGDFSSAKNACTRFVYKQVLNKGLTGGHGQIRKRLDIRTAMQPMNPAARLPIIALARILYRLLGKKGKRGRRSSALKAMILVDRADGLKFETIAARWSITIDNAKRHYRMAWTLLRHYFISIQDMMSVEQKLLLAACSLKDVKNVTSKGEYYDYGRATD